MMIHSFILLELLLENDQDAITIDEMRKAVSTTQLLPPVLFCHSAHGCRCECGWREIARCGCVRIMMSARLLKKKRTWSPPLSLHSPPWIIHEQTSLQKRDEEEEEKQVLLLALRNSSLFVCQKKKKDRKRMHYYGTAIIRRAPRACSFHGSWRMFGDVHLVFSFSDVDISRLPTHRRITKKDGKHPSTTIVHSTKKELVFATNRRGRCLEVRLLGPRPYPAAC